MNNLRITAILKQIFFRILQILICAPTSCARPVECLNFAHRHGELSTSQKQAMITLIEKKDKDKRLLQNWRPISLINMDVKIPSKAMAMTLESILPVLVHHSQNAFIKGRSIFDAIRTIDDILEYAKRNNRPGILVAIDFEKAFDSLDQTFLVKVLQKFNFGTYFFAMDSDILYRSFKLRVKQRFRHQLFLCQPWSQTR